MINLIKKSRLVINNDFKSNLYRISIGKKTSLNFLKELTSTLEIPPEFINQNIQLITSCKNTDIGIKNPKLPFNFSTEEGVRFLASIYGDGELNKQVMVRYNNQNKDLINLVLKSANSVLGDVDYKIYPRKDNTYQLHFPKIAGLIISEFGLKPGRKTTNNLKIPPFIFDCDNKLKAVFIRQFFDDEGNVRLKDRRLQVKQTTDTNKTKEQLKNNVDIYASNTLKDIQQLLKDLGIISKISLESFRNKKADWGLTIYGIENLILFRDKIGFELEYKQRLLENCISSYKFPSAPRNKRLEFALEKCKKVQEKNGFITKHLLSEECKRSIKTSTGYLIELTKKKIIRCIEKPKDSKGHNLPRKYLIN